MADWPVIVLLLAVGTVGMFAWCWIYDIRYGGK
jgi:hypothetical protein